LESSRTAPETAGAGPSAGLWPVYAAFLLSGTGSTLLGPLLPLFGVRLALGDGGAGALFMAQFGGAAVGAIACGWLLEHWGYRRVLVTGYLLLAAGAALLASPMAAIVALGVLMTGLGLGLMIPSSNLLVAETAGPSSASRLNWLNLCGGSGAVAGPPLVAWLRDSFGLGGVAALVCVLAVACATALYRTVPRTQRHSDEGQSGAGGRFQWAMAAMLFLYVGAETTLSGWLPTLAIRRAGAHSGMETLPLSAYWGAMMIGRAGAALLLKRYTAAQLMKVLLTAAPMAAAGLALAAGAGSMTATAAMAGLVFGPIFPTGISTLKSANAQQARRLGPPVFAAASAGGALMPWVAGLVSSGSSDVRVILGPALICLLLMTPAWMSARRAAAAVHR
jgi:fucose permease